MQELRPDAIVEPDAARDLLHVGADFFAQIGDLVDEGDLGGQERVGRVFDQLGGAAAGVEHRRLVEKERAIDLGHDVLRTLVLDADDNAVGMLEIMNGGAFPQEFRVGHHRELSVGAQIANDALDLVTGADRDGRLGDDDREGFQPRGDLAGRPVNIRQVGMSVAAPGRRADRNEHGGSAVQSVGQARGERQPPLPHVRCHELLEARLVDRDLAGIERVNLAGLLVDAGDLMTKICNAGPGNEADIARPDHRNSHELAPKR